MRAESWMRNEAGPKVRQTVATRVSAWKRGQYTKRPEGPTVEFNPTAGPSDLDDRRSKPRPYGRGHSLLALRAFLLLGRLYQHRLPLN